jgi:hypothetical protein
MRNLAWSEVKKCRLPDNALLTDYTRKRAYTDCFTTRVTGAVTLADFVTAFYTTWLFKLERKVLGWLVSRSSTDEEASQLAAGREDTFAAWFVEQRIEDQLLMCDFRGQTRSWFMVMPAEDVSATQTELYFGSAVIPDENSDGKTGTPRFGRGFRLLLGFHKLYSRALLAAARSRLGSR